MKQIQKPQNRHSNHGTKKTRPATERTHRGGVGRWQVMANGVRTKGRGTRAKMGQKRKQPSGGITKKVTRAQKHRYE